MIGKTNSQTSVIRGERVNVLLTTNQSSHDDLKGAVITIAYENVRDEYEYTGSMLTAKVPPYVSYTISVSDVAGYAKPAAVSATAVAGNSRSVTMTYNTTVVTVKMADNQSAYNDIAGATATVAASGISTVTVKDGGSVKVPTGVSCSVTWSAVSGYKTPDKQTFTTSGTSVSKTGTYQTEILTVTVTSDIDLPASYTITVSGIGSQTTASKTYKVPFGTSYTVSASKTSDYKAPKDQSFVANSINRTVVVQYLEFKIGSWITIDQNISDPATMISGEVNGEHIQLIRQNSHRYLGKYTAENTMTICQLDDTDSNMFHDGMPAILTGSYGDVFMKLPRFWYKAVQKSLNVWNIGFYCGDEIDELEDWMEWDGKSLIGVYLAALKNNAMYSIVNGGYPCNSYGDSNGTFIKYSNYVKARGDGFSFIRWEHHCIMAFLFFAMYGHTNSQEIIGKGNSNSKIGVTSSMGMQDTQGSDDVNFWGLESWWPNEVLIENARCNVGSLNEIISVTMQDGSVRDTEPSINNFGNRYTKKIAIGPYLDLVCTATGASSTTGYCDVIYMGDNAGDVDGYVYHCGRGGTADGITSLTCKKFRESCFRIAFYGNIIIEENTSDFIAL